MLVLLAWRVVLQNGMVIGVLSFLSLKARPLVMVLAAKMDLAIIATVSITQVQLCDFSIVEGPRQNGLFARRKFG